MFGLAGLSLRPMVASIRSTFVPSFTSSITNNMQLINPFGLNMQATRFLNRNARRPNKANHGKRPVSHARRWAKRGKLTSVAYREKIFGFW